MASTKFSEKDSKISPFKGSGPSEWDISHCGKTLDIFYLLYEKLTERHSLTSNLHENQRLFNVHGGVLHGDLRCGEHVGIPPIPSNSTGTGFRVCEYHARPRVRIELFFYLRR